MIGGISFFIFLLLHFIIVIVSQAGPLKYLQFSCSLHLISFFGFVFSILKNNTIALIMAIFLSFWLSRLVMDIEWEARWMPGTSDDLSLHAELLILPADTVSVTRLEDGLRPFGGRIMEDVHPKVTGTYVYDH